MSAIDASKPVAQAIENLRDWKLHPEYDRERSFDEMIDLLQSALDKLCEEPK